MHVPLSQPSINQDDIDAVVAVLKTTTLSIGPKVVEFERAAADLVGVKHGIAVNSGTSGLHCCIEGFGIGPGDDVITSPFSFVASANAIIYGGSTPVFADIDEDTLAIDPNAMAAAVTDRTRAIVPVDVFGEPCPIEDYAAIARQHDLRIIQDSCEAIGASRNGNMVGGKEYADAAVFAFYPNKQMTTGEGGVIVTDNDDLARVANSMRNQGRDDAGTWMRHVRLGYNYRLDEMSAALGVSQLSRLDDFLAKRAHVADLYTERLADIEQVRTPKPGPETTRMSWFVYVIRLADGIDRDQVMDTLAANGVPARPYFSPIHLQPYYQERYGYKEGDFPVTERVSATTLAIPFFNEMSVDQVDYVVEQIRAAVNE